MDANFKHKIEQHSNSANVVLMTESKEDINLKSNIVLINIQYI